MDAQWAALEAELGYYSNGVAETKRKMNALRPLCRLPPETLGEIFALHADNTEIFVEDCTIIPSHVCHYWREVALSTPRMWTRVAIDRKLERVEAFLERSKQVPLRISVIYGMKVPANTWRIVLPEFARVASFCACLSQDTYNAVADLFPPSSSHLRTVLMVPEPAVGDALQKEIPDLFRRCSTPNLQKVHLAGYSIRWDKMVLPASLTSLTLLSDLRTGVASVQDPSESMRHMLDALRHLSSLQLLSLKHAIPPLQTVPLHPYLRQERFSLPKLQHLTIASSSASIIHVLNRIEFPPYALIELELDDFIPGDAFTSAIRFLVEAEEVEGDHHELENYIESLTMRERSLSFFKAGSDDQDWDHLTDNGHLKIILPTDTVPAVDSLHLVGGLLGSLHRLKHLFTAGIPITATSFASWLELLIATPELDFLWIDLQDLSQEAAAASTLKNLCDLLSLKDHSPHPSPDPTDPQTPTPTLLVPRLTRLSLISLCFTGTPPQHSKLLRALSREQNWRGESYVELFYEVLAVRQQKGVEIEELAMWNCMGLTAEDAIRIKGVVDQVDGTW
ncbi:hypothetical protein EIP91_008368 [Steccherinum ochraceum]|uniref:Uncharacterized protein n=1 Tax=Steccherinum ochraceum TaxID=92696 RepID=A0A4R0R302_9APHY|nr:hypothetical protein EIP91_008368 [Steccherinum ochraceum]